MMVVAITLSNFQLKKLSPQTSTNVKISLLNLYNCKNYNNCINLKGQFYDLRVKFLQLL